MIGPAAPPPPLATLAGERAAAHAVAADPLLGAQGHLRQIGWTPPPRTGPRPLVAVLDTGVDPSSPDLAGAVLSGAGRSFVAASPDPAADPEGHGTHVAGIIAAVSQNGVGGSGVAAARILPVTVADARGRTTASALVRGLAYASARGARVINISFGGRGFSPAEQEAIDRASSRGALVVVAAGNSGGAAAPEYPGAYRQVLAVGALSAKGRALPISARGPQVALAAPGDAVQSTAPGASPALVPRTGTSMAAAVVSGAAARIMAARPGLSAQQVREILEESARDVPPAGPDSGTGAGALDLAAALAAPDPPRGDPEPNDDPLLAAATRPLLAAGGAPGRTARGRTGSFGDPRDGYVVELAAGDRLSARLQGPAAADLDLVLWRPGARGGARGAPTPASGWRRPRWARRRPSRSSTRRRPRASTRSRCRASGPPRATPSGRCAERNRAGAPFQPGARRVQNVRSMATTPEAPPAPQLTDPGLYINRELSWLEFNARVLALAGDPGVPLLERCKFLAIFTSNLDEFFMVRVATVQDALEAGRLPSTPDKLAREDVLDRIRDRVVEQTAEQSRIWHEDPAAGAGRRRHPDRRLSPSSAPPSGRRWTSASTGRSIRC